MRSVVSICISPSKSHAHALTSPDEIQGCGELYWDDLEHGAPRWTEFSAVAGFSSDLAFCLSDPGTGIGEEEPVTWGRLKTLFR